MLKIGKLELASNVLVAPLAGISDSSFRILCRRFGASFTFVEMINARAISYKNKKTKKMLNADPADRPIGIQILGAEIDYLLKAVDFLKNYNFDLLDLNVACPVKKVCRRGEGAALMKDPQKLKKILEELVSAWPGPVTIKIRSGWDDSQRNAVEIARIAEDTGVRAIFIHGRDRQQFYKGFVDYKIIADVKKNVKIPVIASGDIWSAAFAKKMFDETGCDGILVARGGLGNPWIFKEIDAVLGHRKPPAPPTIDEIAQTILEHLELMIAEHEEKNAVPLMRKFVGWYLKGKRFARPIRQKVNSIKTRSDFLGLVDTIQKLTE